MENYFSNMLARTNNVIGNVINRVFHTRPNLLGEMRTTHETIERQLKAECHRELELMLEMEESFVYADNPLYKETLRRMKRVHKQNSPETPVTTTIVQSARIPYAPSSAPTNRITTSLKRTNGAMSEDNEDEFEDALSPPVKISRPNPAPTKTLSSCKVLLFSSLIRVYIIVDLNSFWTTARQEVPESVPIDTNGQFQRGSHHKKHSMRHFRSLRRGK